METILEERVGRLEVNVEYIRSDVAELKIDIRRLDTKLTDKIDGLKDSLATPALNMEKQFSKIDRSIASLHTARAFDRVWWLLITAGLLGVIAHAVKWI